ncbi:MAG: transposase [Armatimonadota bacterium]|nr:transposase [Armatimonadota bacterium]
MTNGFAPGWRKTGRGLKKARRWGADIIFFDEVGWSFQERVAHTWAPRGHPPVLRRKSLRRELSSAVGLSLRGKIYKRHFGRPIDGAAIIVALDHIRRQVGGKFILVWDRAPTHRARVVTDYLGQHREISVEWLPAYAPELNPEEYCHGNVKDRIRNSTPQSVSEIQALVDRGFARLRRRPDLLLGFFRHAGLTVNQLW